MGGDVKEDGEGVECDERGKDSSLCSIQKDPKGEIAKAAFQLFWFLILLSRLVKIFHWQIPGKSPQPAPSYIGGFLQVVIVNI